ncbi:MAG TPA: CofH family radical SAM protein, partial [Candidatus Methanoperedenaceae archaeon]|nr:CofH family radical SAM protein [Candidatus Methanoperedenaceae archaeon]
YSTILHSIKSEFPHLHLHAYSPMEVSHLAANSRITIKRALLKLKECGLGSMPGTAAEILSKRVREEICPEKLSAREWIEVVETAHRTGIPTTATMMYGHIETVEERIEHLITIREIQKRTGGFTEFVPLPFLPGGNQLGERLCMENGFECINGTNDLKVHAIARIILHTHINNIQVSWVKLGVRLAQIALHCGASDLGGTLMEERISKSAGATSGEYLTPSQLNNIIRHTGRKPATRDTLYRTITPQFE